MEFSKFSECYLPKLKSLNIPLQSGARSNIDAVRAAFIQRHPTLEQLFWVPLSPDSALMTGSLPNLKTCRTLDRIMASVADPEKSLKLETVMFQFLDTQGFAWLQHIDKDSVSRASFAHYDSVSFVSRFIAMFPNLTHLHVGQCHKSSPAPLVSIYHLLMSSNLTFAKSRHG